MAATFVHSTLIPMDGAKTLSRAYFTSPELYGDEMAKIFFSRWLCAGRAAEIPNPGDYFVRQLGDTAVIFVRDV